MVRRKLLYLGAMLLCMLLYNNSNAQIISTIAGTGIQGFSGDGNLATLAKLNIAKAVAVDNAGNVYIADYSNQRIRKINTSGIISTIAGNGTAGFSGDGGLAISAELDHPAGIIVDAIGNVYIADCLNHRIRKINTSGIISTIAGNGTAGFSGDGGLATSAELYSPIGIAVDAIGNVYIADLNNHRIRLLDPSGNISTIVGIGTAGFSGDGGLAVSAELSSPKGVAIDAIGNVYIADWNNQRIRRVDPCGNITTIAGNGTAGFSGDGNLATLAKLKFPRAVAVDADGNVYIEDNGNRRVRKITYFTTIDKIACGSFISPSGHYTWTTSGTYNDTILNAAGCDSAIIVNLTINNIATGTDVITACNSYTWIDGITYTSDNNTATYTLVGGAENGCDSIVTLDLTINNLTISIDAVDPLCVDASAVTVVGSPTGGTFSGDGVTGTSFDPATAGTGTHTITYNYSDGNGCSNSGTIDIIVNPLPVISIDAVDPLCVDASAVTVVGSPTGGTFSGTGVTGNSFDPATAGAGTHTITYNYTDGNGCSASTTTSITVNSKPNAGASSNSPICEGKTLYLTASGGGGGTYSWSGPSSYSSNTKNPNITYASPSNSGIYTVLVTNLNGCSDQATVNVTVNPKPTASASSNSPICADETIHLTATGGGSYSWSGPDSFSSTSQNPDITNATSANSGTYTVTVTNSNNCTDQATVNVTVNSKPNAGASSNSPICEGETLHLTASGGGGGTYSWSGPSSFSSNIKNPNITNASPSNSGTYTVIVTNLNGCSDQATVNVTVNPKPTASASSNSPICADETIHLTATGGGSYSWSGPDSFSSTSQNPDITNATSANSGTYTVTVTNSNNCSDQATVNVTVNAKPNAGASSNSPICEGETLKLTSSGGGGGTYSWSGPSSFSSNIKNPNIPNASPSNSGTYTVIVTNPNGCSDQATVNVTVNSKPNAGASSNSPICEGKILYLTASGGGGGTYSWSGPGSYSSNTKNPNIPNASPSNSGTYTVIVTNPNGCSEQATVNVTVNPKPTATAFSNSPICADETIHLTATGGGPYSWSGPGSFSSTSQNPDITNATSANSGTYTVTVTNSDNCTDQATVNVTVNSKPNAGASSNSPICEGKTLYLTASGGGGGTYSWSGPSSYSSNIKNPSILNTSPSNSGTYTVVVTNPNGCSDQATAEVTVNPKPTATAFSNSPICADETIHLTATGGGTYSWSGPNSFSSTSQNPDITNATTANSGTYTVTVTNSDNCTDQATVNVTVNSKPNAGASSNSPICEGETLHLTASGGGGGTYSWSGPSSYSSNTKNPNITYASPSNSGTYTVIVTNLNGCSDQATVNVTVNPKPTATASSNSPICADETIHLTAAGGGTYSWSGPNSFSSTSQNPDITNATTANSGTYTVTVTNSDNCTDQATVNVTVNSKPNAGASSNSPICPGKTLYLTASGGGGGTYSWSGPSSYSSTIKNPSILNASPSNSGTYTVIVTNLNGCSDQATVNVTVNLLPTISIDAVFPLCVGATPVTLVGSPVGGTFSGAGVTGTSFDPNVAGIGTHTVTYNYTDGNICSNYETIDIIVSPFPTTGTDTQTACVSYTWIDGITYTADNNSVTFTIPGGAANGCDSIVTLDLTINNPTTGTDTQTACISYTWIDGITYTSDNNSATFTIPGGAVNGCDSIVTLNLTINNPTTGTDTQTACVSYTWIDGITYTSDNNTATYTLIGGAVNGCDSIVTLDLTINNPTTGTDTQIACVSYTWIDGNTYTVSNNTATYTITGGAANGCDSIVTLDLTINNPTTATDTQIACVSYTWIDGISYTSDNNTATYTLVGGATNGCDSIVTLDLTINNPTTGTDTQTACVSFTWIDGITYTSDNNTATYTITGGAANGCDSIVTLDLTINNPTTGTDTQTACVSYTWIDGITYTADNNSVTFTIPDGAANGCDSIVTLDLTINNPTTGTDTQTACISYTWIDGITYTSDNNSATFTIPGGAVNGCDSIVTLDLTINNPTTGTDTQTACVSYTWIDGITYTSDNNTATYTLIGGAANGCDSIVTLDLTINNPTTGTDTQTACVSYTWIDGITYTSDNNTATYTLIGGAANGCDSIVTLNLTINTTTGTDTQTACVSYTWIDGITYTVSNNTATYTITGGAANGCDSIVTLDLTINNPTTGTDIQTACVSYTWIDGITYTSDNNTATYTLVGGAVNGCDSIVTLDLTINNPTIDNIIGTQTSCTANDGTITIAASGGTGMTHYSIDNGATFQISGSFTGLGAGNYDIVVKDDNGCEATGTATLTQMNAPELNLVSSSDVTCNGNDDGSSAVVASGGTAPYTYSWSPNVSTSENATNLSAGDYTITVTDDAGCSDNLLVTISEPDAIVIAETIADAGCGQGNGSVILQVVGGDGPYTYAWNPNVSTTATATNLIAGTYEVTITDGNGCTQAGSYTVGMTGSFSLDINPENITIHQSENIDIHLTIDLGVTADSIIWSPAEGLSCTDCQNPVATPKVTTTYYVEVISTDGCSSMDSIIITVKSPCSNIYIPTSFSPNGDGMNDLECVMGECIATLDFTIYDRWGEVVFKTTDQTQCWDGMFRGKLAQTGVYVYKLKATLDNGEKIEESGNVNVVR